MIASFAWGIRVHAQAGRGAGFVRGLACGISRLLGLGVVSDVVWAVNRGGVG